MPSGASQRTYPNLTIPNDPIPVAACKFMPIKMHKKEAENVLCKKDDGENKINNKFCMQPHYETMANGNPLTCAHGQQRRGRSVWAWLWDEHAAIGIFIACSTRRMRNTSACLCKTRFFMAAFDLCHP